MPKTLLSADSIITIPVMKCHRSAAFSCALKNQVGCYASKSRHNIHLCLDEAIVDLNRFLKPCFTVVDGTVALENGGPIIGQSKECNVILASNDLVAADSAASRYLGFQSDEISYIKLAHTKGLGNITNYKISGDLFYVNRAFRGKGDLASNWHMKLRRSVFEPLFFRTAFFRLLAWISTIYQIKWFIRHGKKYTQRFLANSQYNQEYKNNKGSIYFI